MKGVSCTTAGGCTAVGSDLDTRPNPTAHVAKWDGTSWTVQAAPNPAGRNFAWFNGVSCGSAGCTAVGAASINGEAGAASLTLAERQASGSTAWTVQATANTTGVFDTSLQDVSCATATATSCVGVGIAVGPLSQSPVIRRWNGTSWASQTPAPGFGAGRGGDILQAVSCSAPTACMAVGRYLEGSASPESRAPWRSAGTARPGLPSSFRCLRAPGRPR